MFRAVRYIFCFVAFVMLLDWHTKLVFVWSMVPLTVIAGVICRAWAMREGADSVYITSRTCKATMVAGLKL